jgi:hypothetical protein
MRLYGRTNSCPKVLDFPHHKVRGRTRTNGAIRSFEPVGNPARQIIRRHFDEHLVAGELATILLRLASRRRPTLDNRRFIGHYRYEVECDVIAVAELQIRGLAIRRRRSSAGFILEINIRERLSVGVAHNETIQR